MRNALRDEPGRRRKALRAGHGAESAAVLYLRCKGYRILARHFLVKGGEIDIVAQRGQTIAFVEVKLRSSLDNARIAIDPPKQRRIGRAAKVFVARYRLANVTLRADAIYLAPWRWPQHLPAAFELDLD